MVYSLKEDIRNEIQSQGRFLLGMANIDYPVYLLHLDYKKPNDDPMFFIDQAICDFIRKQPKTNFASLSRIIGMDEKLVLYRFEKLKSDAYVVTSKDGNYITPNGIDYFFNDEIKIPYIDVSMDFLIDGTNLSLLPTEIYEFSRFSSKDTVLVHKIINNATDVSPLLRKIEGMTDTNKAKYNFEAGSKELRNDSLPSKGTITVTVVFSQDKRKNVYKEIYYEGNKISLPGLANILPKSTFGDYAMFSYGYGNGTNSENIAIYPTEKNCNFMINSCLGVDANYQGVNRMINEGLLCVLITPDIINKCNEPIVLKKFYANGYCDFSSKNENSFISFKVMVKDGAIIDLFKFDDKIEDARKTGNFENVIEYCQRIGIVKSRKNLLKMKRYDVLEQLDNTLYINFQR